MASVEINGSIRHYPSEIKIVLHFNCVTVGEPYLGYFEMKAISRFDIYDNTMLNHLTLKK